VTEGCTSHRAYLDRRVSASPRALWLRTVSGDGPMGAHPSGCGGDGARTCARSALVADRTTMGRPCLHQTATSVTSLRVVFPRCALDRLSGRRPAPLLAYGSAGRPFASLGMRACCEGPRGQGEMIDGNARRSQVRHTRPGATGEGVVWHRNAIAGHGPRTQRLAPLLACGSAGVRGYEGGAVPASDQ